MPTFLFVDDHPLYRSGLFHALGTVMPGLDVELAENAEQVFAVLARRGDIDLCLSDHRLGDSDGLVLLRQVGERFPTVARGLLCSVPTRDLIRQAQELGCVACLSKERGMDELAAALATLFDGGTVFDLPGSPGSDPLSERRMRILALAAQGRSNKEIADQLAIAERTVKDHWSYIFGQLGVANRAEAISRAHQSHWI